MAIHRSGKASVSASFRWILAAPIFSAAPGKGIYCRTDAETSDLYPLLSQEAQDVIGQVHPQTAPARAVLEKEGFRYRNYIDIFDGGPTLECDIDRVRAIRKSRLVEVAEGQPAQGDFPACLVANENYHHFRVVLVRTDPATERLILTAAQLDALKCHAGDRVRLVRLCAEEKTA